MKIEGLKEEAQSRRGGAEIGDVKDLTGAPRQAGYVGGHGDCGEGGDGGDEQHSRHHLLQHRPLQTYP